MNKAPLKPNELARKGRQLRFVKLYNLAILLLNAHKVDADNLNWGFDDADATLEQIIKRYNRSILMDPMHIESLLWASNMLDEKGEFIHPAGTNFKDWVKEMFPRADFDYKYNTITFKKREKNKIETEHDPKQ